MGEDPGSPRDPERRYARVDATLNYRKELEENLNVAYPEITWENIDDFRNGKISFGSINLKGKDIKLIGNVLTSALERASDPQDVAHSTHGAEHDVYQETLSVLAEHIEEGQYSIRRSRSYIKITTDAGIERIPIERFVLEGQQFLRTTYRPEAIEEAESLKKENDLKKVNKELRRICLSRGVPYGILVATYFGFSLDDIFSFFAEPNFQKSLKDELGDKIKIPTRNRKQDANMLRQLSNNIVVRTASGEIYPQRSADAHQKGLETLLHFGWIEKDQVRKPPLLMKEVEDLATPKAILVGMTEAAQRRASKSYKDPDKSEYILDEYSNVSTTMVVTAYLEIQPVDSNA